MTTTSSNARALTNVRWTGTLPYAAVETYERLKVAFRTWREQRALQQDTAFIELDAAFFQKLALYGSRFEFLSATFELHLARGQLGVRALMLLLEAQPGRSQFFLCLGIGLVLLGQFSLKLIY